MTCSTLKHLAILATASLAMGCAATSGSNNRKDMAVAAGFKVIKPAKLDQQAALEKLPADKFTRVTHAGKTYYVVLPDRGDGPAYVGNPKQYRAYQEDRQARGEAQEYEQSTSERARETSEDYSNAGLNLLKGWDWSATDGQTD